MKSQTLAKSVFELHPVSISIDESGFRETTPLAAAKIFALGDSFTLGWGVKQNETWVEQLEKAMRRPIYNLGVSGLSPKQELLLLEYMLKQGKEAPQISHLLWMIYEGNDLEDHYEPMRVAEKHAIRDYLAGTVLEHLLMIPLMARDEAIITKLLNGQVRLKSLAGSSTALHDEVDGVTLPHPLFRSSIHGNRLFHSLYLRRASETRSYVMDHPNRAALEQVFKDMASLAKRYHFDVTVVIAPTDSRLYASHFEDFPSISEQPYFINLVADMSHKMGFQTINLLPLLQSYARAELLYFRDDDHWNVRGNQVVAEILARHFHTNDVRP
jgi:hypothetical protein